MTREEVLIELENRIASLEKMLKTGSNGVSPITYAESLTMKDNLNFFRCIGEFLIENTCIFVEKLESYLACSCGGRGVKDDKIQYTSNPPVYKYTCNKCGRSTYRP